MILLVQADGSFPNLALMRIASHYRMSFEEVKFTRNWKDACSTLDRPDRVYVSAIFEKSMRNVEEILKQRPDAIIGGSGTKLGNTLADIGVRTWQKDYSLYPEVRYSIGYTQRGCRFKCGFCVVPKSEGEQSDDERPLEIWRGGRFPRKLMLLDNDFFGGPCWKRNVKEIVGGKFKVCLCQGINLRAITDEQAEALSCMDCRDVKFKTKRIYTAWDNPKEGTAFFDGLDKVLARGVDPDNIMVYMLVGYWPGETIETILDRRDQLRRRGVRPYPMPYRRTTELIGLQRWIVQAWDKAIPWSEWAEAGYQPRNLKRQRDTQLGLFGGAR